VLAVRQIGAIFILVASAGLPISALDPGKPLSQFVLTSWSSQSGLSQKSVMGVTQTSDGYIWLGTEEGLVRYDGLSFRTYDERNSPGLPDRLIRSLAAGRDGGLWVGTRSGLAHYQNGVFSSLVKETAFSDDIYDLYESSDGSIWFSSDQGLHRFQHGRSRVYTTADGLPDNRITTIAQGSDGSIWAGTRAGLVRFAGERFLTYARENETLTSSINALWVGANGIVWIGTSGGEIDRWYKGRITRWWVDPKRHAQIQCIHEDRNGTVWLAFERLGLGRLRGRKVELFTKSDGLPSNDPDWMFEDREQNMWIGWADAGVSTLREGKFATFGAREGLSSDHTSSVLEAKDGSLWIGTEDGGVNHIRQGKVEVYAERQGLPAKDFVSVVERRDGTIWTGSDRGYLSKIERGRITTYGGQQTVPPRVAALLEDTAGQLWVGFEEQNGLSRFSNGHFEHLRFEHLGFEHLHMDGRIKALAEAPDGALWIVAYGQGVYRYSKGALTAYTEKQGLSSRKATTIYVDKMGTVWAGTAQAGLNRIRDGRVTKYSGEQGLSDDSIGSILEDDYGYLWLTGSRSISRIRKKELDDLADGRTRVIRETSYGIADGIRSPQSGIGAQPSAWKAKDGTLWFATTGGLASINPSRMQINTIAPPVNLDEVLYGGQAVDGLAELKSGLGRMDFNFTAPSFISPASVRVRYRLDGYDSNWVDAGTRRSASYTNLPPGRYAFHVEAANADGVWNPKESIYRFRLRPKFYQDTWFQIVSVLVISVLIWRVYLIRVRYLVERNRVLEQKVQLRTAELLEAVKAAERAKDLLREHATVDSLTGLWNRRAIFDNLEKEMTRCMTGSGNLSVLMIDLDHFKEINDRFGHLAGDQVLQQAAVRFRGGLRESDVIGRYGGEEFLVILPDCSASTAMERAEELRHILHDLPIATDAGSVWVTCSVGVAGMAPGCTRNGLVGAADAALYVAKAGGRNRVEVQDGISSLELEPPITV
jgi:diguanylate cyclase (GGDEF)-like protein